MSNRENGVASRLQRTGYGIGIFAVLCSFVESLVPLVLTVVGSFLLGLLIKFILYRRINKRLHQSYRAYGPRTGQYARHNGAGHAANTGAGQPRSAGQTPPDPLAVYRAFFGLPPQYTKSGLKAAYRAMAARYHPDRYSTATSAEQQAAEDMMKKVNEAYEKLQK
jgi:preprotein translocase subunit Sec63